MGFVIWRVRHRARFASKLNDLEVEDRAWRVGLSRSAATIPHNSGGISDIGVVSGGLWDVRDNDAYVCA